jgi:hypothetical protein
MPAGNDNITIGLLQKKTRYAAARSTIATQDEDSYLLYIDPRGIIVVALNNIIDERSYLMRF